MTEKELVKSLKIYLEDHKFRESGHGYWSAVMHPNNSLEHAIHEWGNKHPEVDLIHTKSYTDDGNPLSHLVQADIRYIDKQNDLISIHLYFHTNGMIKISYSTSMFYDEFRDKFKS